jgi:short subunit fatty acids transporter
MAEQLKDIKPLLEIPDYSYYLYFSLLTLFVFFILLLMFFLIRWWLKPKKMEMKEIYFSRLKSVDWSDSKKAAYEVTFVGRVLSLEDSRIKEMYQQLLPHLEAYKYRPKVEKVDNETLNKYTLLVHIIDESL